MISLQTINTNTSKQSNAHSNSNNQSSFKFTPVSYHKNIISSQLTYNKLTNSSNKNKKNKFLRKKTSIRNLKIETEILEFKPGRFWEYESTARKKKKQKQRPPKAMHTATPRDTMP